MYKFALTGGTFTGNRGAEAMVLACISQIKTRYPDAVVHVLSYAPKADAAWLVEHPIQDVYLHSLTPLKITAGWLPVVFAMKLLRLRPGRLDQRNDQGIKSLLAVDTVIDLAGVSFMDSRLKFLPFNVLTLLPFLLNRVKVWKLSQAMGPIKKPLNRMAAGWVFKRMAGIFTRGGETLNFINTSAIQPCCSVRLAPDITFTLRSGEPSIATQERLFDFCVIPSALMVKKHPHYKSLLVDAIRMVASKGYTVNLVVHSWKSHTDLPRNNDLPLAKELVAALGNQTTCRIIGEGLDALQIKTKIGRHKVSVTSRFHGMIAALDTVTPCLVLGWSHKYREVLDDFDATDCALDVKKLHANQLAERMIEIIEQAAKRADTIRDRLPSVRRKAASQFEIVFSDLEASS